jgi:hypothetical protein
MSDKLQGTLNKYLVWCDFVDPLWQSSKESIHEITRTIKGRGSGRES